MLVVIYILMTLMGLIFGSFTGVLIYRIPAKMKLTGRSFCDHCLNQIRWYDNIPLLSFFLLKGKCRRCGKKIPLTYPLIEIITGLVFVVVSYFILRCQGGSYSVGVCLWWPDLRYLTFPFYFFTSIVLLTVFFIDLKHKIIPDVLVLGLLSFVLIFLVFFPGERVYLNLFSGAFAGFLLLALNLITKGKGMGLGDVKLAVPLGMILSWPGIVMWFFLSFLTGAVVGTILVLVNKAKFKDKIAFGPFLIVSFFLTLFFADYLSAFFSYLF